MCSLRPLTRARIKYFRNVVYAHAEHASVDDSEFHRHWKDIRDTLVRLGGVNYEVKVCYYSFCCCCFFFRTTDFPENLNTYIINLYIYLTTPNLIFVAYFRTLRNWHGRCGKSLGMIECSQPFIFPNFYLMNSRIHASVDVEL